MVIEARRAADLLGATKMDRPEDIEANPKTNKVYVVLTNNNRRKAEQVDAANPRADNRFGHIIEMIPPDGDHAARQVPLGDPGALRRSRRSPTSARRSRPTPPRNGWFGMPDNCRGRQPRAGCGSRPTAIPAQAPAAPTASGASRPKAPARGTSKHFFRAPVGAEMCGPCFTPDDETLFVAVQHPGEADDDAGPAATFENPVDALAGLQAGHAAAPLDRRDHARGGGKIGV